MLYIPRYELGLWGVERGHTPLATSTQVGRDFRLSRDPHNLLLGRREVPRLVGLPLVAADEADGRLFGQSIL